MNNAGRFLLGGIKANALELQEDAVQEHTHYLTDPGHWHRYKDVGGNGGMAIPGIGYYAGQPPAGGTTYHSSDASTTGISVNGMNTGRQSFETRPKNMKVTFIMKIC